MTEGERKPEAYSQALPERGQRPNVEGPEMHPYQFELDIVSVHYYRLQNWAYCAILLSTTFQLRNDKLESARIQIRVETEDEDLKSTIDISSHYPDQQELVEVLRGSEKKVISRKPNVHAGGTVATIQVSGIGSTKTTATDVRRTISLVGSRRPRRKDCPPEIEWIFEDPCGVFYPKQTKTLLIVAAHTTITEFPFNLRFGHPPLEVQVHRKSWFPTKWFKKRPPAPVDWAFPVAGGYKPEIADEAVRDTRTADGIRAPRHFGLKKAAIDWIEQVQAQKGQKDGMQNGPRNGQPY